MQPLDVINAAGAAWRSGISVVPVREDGSKRPDLQAWAEYQGRRPTLEELVGWYGKRTDPLGRTGVGWVMGAVSGGMECLDFDDAEALDEYQARALEFGAADLLGRVMDAYLEVTPRGVHLFWRCETIAGNQRLAADAAGKVRIETRGEGGYVVVAPSYGEVHQTGAPYISSGEAADIVTLTADERDTLLSVARSLDRRERVEILHEPERATTPSDGTRPGDIYADRVNWAQVLEPFGWRRVSRKGGEEYWTRPGARTGGIDATTNYADSGLLYVFSTSALPFEIERGYGKFSAFALLAHGGDYQAAARDLAGQGFSEDVPAADFGSSITLKPSGGVPPAASRGREHVAPPSDGSRSDSYRFDHGWPDGHFVTRYIAWAASQTDAPHEYHEAGALALLASCTPNVRSFFPPWPSGLATNLYLLIVGGTTASRKSTSLGYATALMRDVEASTILPNRATPEALIEALSQRSRRGSLIIGDEFGASMEQMLGRASYMSAAPGIILEAYGTRAYRYTRRSKRNQEGDLKADFDEMIDPHLSLLTASTASIFEAITTREVQSGLLPRFAFIWPSSRPARRPFYEPAPDAEDERAWLLDYLQRLFRWSSTSSMTNYDIPARWAHDAELVADEVVKRIEDEPNEIVQRLAAMELKVAMLSSLGDQVPAVQEMVVELRDAKQGERVIGRWHDAALRFAAEVGGLTVVQRIVEHGHERILEALKAGPMKRSQVSRDLKLTAKQTDDIEQTLLDRGLIEVMQQAADGPGRPAKIWRLA